MYFKRVTPVMLAMVIIFGLSGCSGGDAADKTQDGTSQEAVQSQGAQANNPATGEPGASEGAQSTEPQADRKDTIIVLGEQEPPAMTSFDNSTLYTGYMNKLMYTGLFESDTNLKAVPMMLESYEAESDLCWVMTLKEGMKFHDGTTVTSEDVKASLEFTATFPTNLSFTQTISEIEIVDERTFKLYTEEPSAKLLDDLAHRANSILPKALIEAGHDFNNEPVGSGPYKFVNWTLGDTVTFEAFDDYYDVENRAQIKNLIWRTVPEGSSRTIAMETGEADFNFAVAATDIERLGSNPDIEVLMVPGNSHYIYILNTEKEPFNNVDFRRGIAAAINKQDLIDVAVNGTGTAGDTQIPSILGMVSSEDTVSYDPVKAQEYFDNSGFDLSTITIDAMCTAEVGRRCCEYIQAVLGEYGITVSITQLDMAAGFSAQYAGEFDTAISALTRDNVLHYLGAAYRINMINSTNRSRFYDEEVDALIQKAESTIDDDERQEVIMEVTRLLNQYTPEIPLFVDNVKRAYHKDLGGVVASPTGTVWFNKMYWK